MGSARTLDKAALAEALENVLGPIDTEEAAARAVEAVCQALGWRPDGSAQGAVGALRELHEAGCNINTFVDHEHAIQVEAAERWDRAMTAASDLLGGR